MLPWCVQDLDQDAAAALPLSLAVLPLSSLPFLASSLCVCKTSRGYRATAASASHPFWAAPGIPPLPWLPSASFPFPSRPPLLSRPLFLSFLPTLPSSPLLLLFRSPLPLSPHSVPSAFSRMPFLPAHFPFLGSPCHTPPPCSSALP